MQTKPGTDGDHVTFCRLCEAYCGMVATVKEGKVVRITPDKDNPHSLGHVCVKGVTFNQVTHDPDRVTRPLKRVGGPGEFEAVAWDDALEDIAARLGAIIDLHGPDAVASYKGNPIAFGADASIGLRSFVKALGIDKYYGAGSQDTNARFAASYMAFGSAVTYEIPDLPNCDFLIVIGANPLVSNGSLFCSPRVRHDLDAIAARGRVVVVDPRRTETAQRYEHIPIRANGDVWFLLGLLCVLADEELIDRAFIAERTVGWEVLEAEIAKVDVRRAAERSGVPAATIADIARGFATTRRAVAYGRLGICRGPFATLENFLLTALNIVAGKACRPGGAIFSRPILGGGEMGMPGGYGDARSRFGDFPSVAQFLPSAMMPADIMEDGEGKVRALLCTGGNVLLAAPGGATLRDALQTLDLMVSFDFYQNESNKYAHYILPTPTFLERDDVPMAAFGSMIRPFFQFSDAVIEPVGESRSEWDIFCELLTRMGREMPSRATSGHDGARPNQPSRPMEDLDAGFRTGPVGDRFGEREGWSFQRLREHPHGVMLDLPEPYDWWDKIAYPDRKFRLWHELLVGEFERLWSAAPRSDGLKLITRRDVRSMNSWLHNVGRLVRSQFPALLVNPADAERLVLGDGEVVRLSTEHGAVTVTVAISDEIMEGVVCYPHGWGHDGGWRTANDAPGSNINWLLGIGAEVVERISGTTIMDGIDVGIATIAPQGKRRPVAEPPLIGPR